ncbi:Serine/threonine-protein phosphatase 1 regulatory subunit PIG1 [Zancudomyces culisetae]|uniref:Serine/threonine-protein phosphatase 1 regulatory subunit PIG1 n=1 Tax=Zancudomyces culisetae TaxID=1213189 RepID=A0A1R1PST4_ZANCU|nr:Serine/threonine-protein phosphatase 1 regulatory subunit PIG1 [Zancudomyces culisetae]|eukprot:OMH84004.1 Serine/threonine-protein phosphatase 1 regulatory subunit PIG1 [Zancudomyces culisetae]
MSPTRKVSFDNEVEVVEFSQKDSEAVSVKKRIMDGLGCLDFNNGSRTLTNYRSSRCRKPVVEYLISSDSDKDVPENIALSSHPTSNESGSSKDGLNGRHSDWNYGNLGYLSEKSTTTQKTKGAKADISATIEKKTITSPIENRYRSISSSGSRNIKWGKPQQVQNSLRTIQVIRGPQYAQSGLSMIGLNQEVELQSINYDKDMNVLYGNIMVKNICFEKSVVIRYTTNNWEESSIREVNAKYNTSLTSNGSDLFLYVLDLNEIQQNNSISGLRSGGGVGGGYVTSTIDLEFCIRYRAGQCVANEFWDNNNNQNYFVRVFTFPQ